MKLLRIISQRMGLLWKHMPKSRLSYIQAAQTLKESGCKELQRVASPYRRFSGLFYKTQKPCHKLIKIEGTNNFFHLPVFVTLSTSQYKLISVKKIKILRAGIVTLHDSHIVYKKLAVLSFQDYLFQFFYNLSLLIPSIIISCEASRVHYFIIEWLKNLRILYFRRGLFKISSP